MTIKCKLFSKVSEIKESTITIEVPKTDQEVFDAAVAEVLKDKQREAIWDNLINYVHGEEVVSQHKLAKEEYPSSLKEEKLKEAREKYPLVKFYVDRYEQGGHVENLYIDLHRVVDKSLDVAYGIES